MRVTISFLTLFASLIVLPGAMAQFAPQASVFNHHKAAMNTPQHLVTRSQTAPGLTILAASSGDSTGHSPMKQPSYSVGDLVISDVRAGATVPKAPVAGGYMLIRNNGSAPDFLIGGQAAFSGDVQIHEMKMQGDVMKMRELADGLEIPAGGEVMLRPGGYHVMFMKLTGPLTAGERRKATLTFRNAGSVEVEFSVLSRQHLNAHGKDHSGHGSSN